MQGYYEVFICNEMSVALRSHDETVRYSDHTGMTLFTHFTCDVKGSPELTNARWFVSKVYRPSLFQVHPGMDIPMLTSYSSPTLDP